jgi:hypothetical protein
MASGQLPSRFRRRVRRAPQLTRAWLLSLCALIVCLAAPRMAAAEPPSGRIGVLAPELRIYLVTFGPGDHPFAKFGHNAIAVTLPDGRGAVYNFGTFGGETSSLIGKFLKGRFHYWLSVSPPEPTYDNYALQDRTVELVELSLPQERKLALWRKLELNALPENREYLYDYFVDNCSTRVRDALDGVLDRQLEAQLSKLPAELTFRQQALRLAESPLWLYLGLHFGLGPEADRPRTQWEDGFIPEALAESLRPLKVSYGSEPVPVVASQSLRFRAARPPALAAPPMRWPWFLLAGAGLGGLFWASLALSRQSRLARFLAGAIASLVTLAAGLLGCALLFLWLFTNHQIAFRNQNLWLAPPWLLAAAVASVGLALGRLAWMRRMERLLTLTVWAAVLSVPLQWLPWFRQANLEFFVLFAPLWTGLLLGVRRLLTATHPAPPRPREA